MSLSILFLQTEEIDINKHTCGKDGELNDTYKDILIKVEEK